MTRYPALSIVLSALVAAAVVPHAAAAQERAVDSSDSVFGLTRVWKIHLEVSSAQWKAMQPQGGGLPFGPPGSAPRPAPSGELPRGPQPGPGAAPGPGFRPGSFGYEFDYVPADVEWNGERIAKVGLRFKGNGTYMVSAQQRKRPFKIDFNRYVDDQRFHGLQQVNLHNNVMDPTHLRQALSYAVFQAAGIPTPRTAFAEVTLTIPGECDHESLGLYTLVEEIDKAFLKRHFQTSKGLLMKPEGTQGLEYKGDDWNNYVWFEAKTKPRPEETRHVIEALRLIHEGSDDDFRRDIGRYLDLEELASFLAANCLLANMDSFLTHVHNYYVYLPPKGGRLALFPWDMDLSLGAFFMAGTAEQLQDLSIEHPHMGSNRLLDRILGWDTFQTLYRSRLKELNEKCFSEQGQTRLQLAELRRELAEPLAAEAQRASRNGPPGFGGPAPFGAAGDISVFLARRYESVRSQLEGKSQGRVPAMGFGPGGPRPQGGPRPGGFGPGQFHGPQILEAGDTDKDKHLNREELLALGTRWFKAWDEDQNSRLAVQEMTEGFNKVLAPPANAPGGFRPPAGFGPGNFLAPPLLKLADTNTDGAADAAEWETLFQGWFEKWDTPSSGRLSEAQIIEGFNQVFRPQLPAEPRPRP